MGAIKRWLRHGFMRVEALLDRAFPPHWNPLHQLGALGFYFFWIICVSGFYLYLFFDTGLTEAYNSVEALTNGQWWLGGIMRSLHRYASDGMVAVMVIHMVREFAFDHYRGPRWFNWFTGVPILWLVIICGITGYWLVWDTLAQYVAITTSELLDWLPIFGEPVARNFMSPDQVDDRFFTLMAFLHIALPLLLLLVMWIHLHRISRSRSNAPRGLAIGVTLMLLVLSLVQPAISHEAADLSKVPGDLRLDWFYLVFYPLIDRLSEGQIWGMAGALTLILAVIPVLPPGKRPRTAVVNLESCNGCARCVDDCPYAAVSMARRTDDQPFEQQAVVDPARCVSCGICVGSCPTATPFRRRSALVPGIDMAGEPLSGLRERTHEAAQAAGGGESGRVVVYYCRQTGTAADYAAPGVAPVELICSGHLPPGFVDYVLSRDIADGVAIVGCREGECLNRFGTEWTAQRLARQRDPYLRRRVPDERVRLIQAAPIEHDRARAEISEFRARMAALGPFRPAPREKTERREETADA